MNQSLASALCQHGVVVTTTNNDNNSSSSSQHPHPSQTFDSRNSRKKTNIQALTVHPSLPRVAYLEEETVTTTINNNAATTAKKRGSPTSGAKETSIRYQRLVIQEYNQNGSGIRSNKILINLPMEKLPSALNNFRLTKSKSSKLSNQQITLASLGPILSITFLDKDALYWNTSRGQQVGHLSNLEMCGIDMYHDNIGSNSKDEEQRQYQQQIVLHADSDLNNVNGIMGNGICLGLQFTHVSIILQFNNNNKIGGTKDDFIILCCLEGQCTSSGGGKDRKVQYTPTSVIVPVSNSIIVYGCSDGAIRFYNLVPSTAIVAGSSTASSSSKQTRQATIKSVRGPNGRNDPVVSILNVDPFYYEGNTHSSSSNLSGGKETLSSDNNTLVIRSRILTICASGVAFLWDVYVLIDRSTNALRDLNVLPPLVRLDGLGSLTTSPRVTPGLSSQINSAGGFWSTANLAKEKGGDTEAPYSSIVAPSVSYDPHRNLLTWTLPSNAPASSVDHRGDYELESYAPNSIPAKREADDQIFLGKWVVENGGFVKVWDLSLVDTLISSVLAPSSAPRPPPKIPPIAIMKLPTSVASTDNSPRSIIAGLSHAPMTTSSLCCVSLSANGLSLLVHTAPLPVAINSTDDGNQESRSSSSAPSSPGKKKNKNTNSMVTPKLVYVNQVPCHEVRLASGGAMSHFPRSAAISASYFAPDTVVVATNQGVSVASIADGESWSTKIDPLNNHRRNPFFSTGASDEDKSIKSPPVGPVHSIISIGGVGNRLGIVFVENHTVYSSRLGTTTSSSNDPKDDGLVKKVELHEPMMLCQLHERKVPWRTTRLTRMSSFVESSRSMECPPRLLPSPSGRYLCLYWDSKRSYEILHAGSLLAKELGPLDPSVDSGSRILSFAWVGEDDNFALLREGQEVFPQDPKSEDYDFGDPSMEFMTSKGGQPKVEMHKLAEVTTDAVELEAGASVALAATTVSLGTLAIRGDDRVTPRSLFGGPSLCVGCTSTSSRTEISDDVTYFYSRRNAAVETNDERASAYMTVGTSIPYPGLVTWDDSGQLCAISYGSRVAIYLSEESNFILLGSIRIVGLGSFGTLSLVSMKFIHGVLYCSTASSVHVIFLGNLEENNTVCELDTFVIATNGVPVYGTDNPDVSSPVPVIAALSQPHILSYHSGGLLVSTSFGLRLLPLSHPIIRIGTLLGANLIDRARKWIFAMPKAEHDILAHFLIRRGYATLALRDLNCLSLETCIDLLMRYELTDELEHLLIYTHGPDVIQEISEWGRSNGHSAFLSIGIYMLGKDKVDCVRRLIASTIESGSEQLLVDSMKLANFVSALDKSEGNEVLSVNEHIDIDLDTRQVAHLMI